MVLKALWCRITVLCWLVCPMVPQDIALDFEANVRDVRQERAKQCLLVMERIVWRFGTRTGTRCPGHHWKSQLPKRNWGPVAPVHFLRVWTKTERLPYLFTSNFPIYFSSSYLFTYLCPNNLFLHFPIHFPLISILSSLLMYPFNSLFVSLVISLCRSI